MNHGNFQANELLALNTIREMPIFNAFGDMDFQRLLELMQQPVRAIDTCMGKEQLRTVAKQLLVQNLALQTRVRNHEIKAIGDAQHFEEAFDELDKAIAKHTDFDGLEQLMQREAEQQDAIPAGATHHDDKAGVYVAVDPDGSVSVHEDGQWLGTEPSDDWVKGLRKLEA